MINSLLALLIISVAFNCIFMGTIIFRDYRLFCSCRICDYTKSNVTLNKEEIELYFPKENSHRSSLALERATHYATIIGEGRSGWLWLLAAVDLDRNNLPALFNLVDNYRQLEKDYSQIGFSELKQANLSLQQQSLFINAADIKVLEEKLMSTRTLIVGNDNTGSASIQLPSPDITITFATLLSTWNLTILSKGTIAEFNDQVYNVTVTIYEKLRGKYPHMDATSLNHKFFQYQMRYLADAESLAPDFSSVNIWTGFQSIPHLKELIALLRRAVVNYLEKHGMSNDQAIRKASHPLVVWASVHTPQSVHQPHVTEDALVGGVYYVRVPHNAGRLELYDPRGKSPLRDLNDPMSPPSPPFHRVVGVQPVEGKLVLFPGWLVHSVLNSSTTSQSSDDEDELCDSERPYRVSLSLNLKGEWQDTASLHVKL